MGYGDINEIPEIRYRNRWDSPAMMHGNSRGFAMAGTYHLAVGLADNSKRRRGLPVAVRFSIAVDGEVHGVPEFPPVEAEVASPTPTASPEPEETAPVSPTPTVDPSPRPTPTVEDVLIDADPPAEGSALSWIGAGLVAIGALGAGAWVLLRRRR